MMTLNDYYDFKLQKPQIISKIEEIKYKIKKEEQVLKDIEELKKINSLLSTSSNEEHD